MGRSDLRCDGEGHSVVSVQSSYLRRSPSWTDRRSCFPFFLLRNLTYPAVPDTIPSAIGQLVALQTLSIIGNTVAAIPSSFLPSPSLPPLPPSPS